MLRFLLTVGASALTVAWAPAAAQALSFNVAPGSPFPAGGNDPSSLAVGEFNGDMHPDLAVANGLSSNVSVFLGTGGGSFAAAPGSPLAIAGTAKSVAVGEFNSDANPDLAVAATNDVSVFLGSGGGSFAAAPGSPFATGGSGAQSVAVGEFNGDANPDLAVLNGSSDDVSVFLGSGGGSFAAAPGSPFLTGGTDAESLAVGEFNGDANPDLAVVHFTSDNVSVFLGAGGGSFNAAPGSPFPTDTSGQVQSGIAVGEFSGDAIPDLAILNRNSPATVSVFLGIGGGQFNAAPGSPFPTPPGGVLLGVAVGEFNGDTNPDLAIANSGGSGSPNVVVLLGAGNGSFVAALRSPFGTGAPGPNGARAVAVGGFNGDTDPDLAVANGVVPSTISVLLGGNGYARPAGATPLKVSLVPAYRACRVSNRTHGPSLSSPSCAPPVQLSHYLTIGTPDANGLPATSTGSVRLRVDPSGFDVLLDASVTDVRNSDDLSDYTGQLQARITLQLTDKDLNGLTGYITARPGEPATLTATTFPFAIPCAATGGAVGSTCSVNTTAEAITPGIVNHDFTQGNRAIWQVGQVRVDDGGEDGLASTDDNQIFMKQGVFVP